MQLPNIQTSKYLKPVLYFIAGFALCLFLYRSCKGETITIPEKSGTLHDTIKVTVKEFVPKDKIIYKSIPYEKIKTDTIYKDGKTVYIEPIDTLKTLAFSKPYEDKNVKICAKGIVTGRLNDLTIDYTIKEQKVPVKPQMGVLIGVETGIKDYDFQAKANLMVQLKNQGIISAGYDTQKRVWIGYNIKLK